MTQNSKWLGLALTALFAVACSHAPTKVKYSGSTNPSEVIQAMEADVQDGYTNQVDVLAQSDFNNAQKGLADGRKQFSEGGKQDKVLATLGEARAYLDRAKALADGRRANLEGVLQARQSALNAGARNFPKRKGELAMIDDEVRDVSGEPTIGSSEYSNLQNRYLDLEMASIQSSQLETARAKVERARSDNAKKFTPRTLNRAEIDLHSAENMIASHRHEDQVFKPAVDKANASAELLVLVGQKARAGKAVIPEDVALKLVFQERGLKSMSDRLQAMESQTKEKAELLSEQDQELKKARETQALERALAQARKEFSHDEADVYRDGSKLLIRLKSMNFPIGSADLPRESLALLGKVRTVTEELAPTQVVIEGHTDSIGNAQVNGQLSQKRAEAVAQYLETNGIESDKIQAIGFGFKKPIGSNKSKAGRAQNRRVDIIITPGTAETATTSM